MSTDRWFRRYLYGCGSITAAVTAVAVASNPPEPVGVLVGTAITVWVTLVVTLLIPYGAVAIAISDRLRQRGGRTGAPRTPDRQPDRPGVAPEPVSRVLRWFPGEARLGGARPRGRVRSSPDRVGRRAAAESGPGGLDDTSAVASVPPPVPDTADALPDDTNLVVSPAILALAEALRPLRAKLRERLAEPPWEGPPIPLWDEGELVDEMVRVLSEWERTFHGSVRALNALARRGHVRGARRGARSEGRRPRRETGRHAARQPRRSRDVGRPGVALDWLDRVLDVLADPLAAGKRQRAPIEHGKVMLDGSLDFTTPPELADLDRWLDRRTAHYQRASDYSRTSGRGFGESVAAAVIGFAIGDWLFGGDE